MQQGRVRPIAIAVIRRGDDIFVFEGHDDVKHELFYRPLGGGIEFGEHSSQAVVREIREELGAQIIVERFLGAIENVFTVNGKTGHEIVMIYEAQFADPALYSVEQMTATEDSGEPFAAMWKPLSHFASGKAPLYPTGLLELLTGR
jgi:8-oxo-dGTP pyrophosphatase MutT (NUDIX family)